MERIDASMDYVEEGSRANAAAASQEPDLLDDDYSDVE